MPSAGRDPLPGNKQRAEKPPLPDGGESESFFETGICQRQRPDRVSGPFDQLKAVYEEEYSSYADYSLTETTVNGYRAPVMKYYDDRFGAKMYVDVDFGGEYDGCYGVSFNVGADTLAECDSDAAWAIIRSLEFAN